MARSITKVGSESVIYAFVVENMGESLSTINVDGTDIEYTDILVVRGNKSYNSAQILCEKQFGKNSMVVHLEKRNASKLTLSASKFIAHSHVCEADTSYGHDYITAEFKVTVINVMYRDASGMHSTSLIYAGETTDSKLINFAREETHSKMCVVKSKFVKVERRYMSRDKYELLATVVE